MPVSLQDKLVVAISSRALFDFEEENRVFDAQDPLAYMRLQQERLAVPARPGVAIPLVRKILARAGITPDNGGLDLDLGGVTLADALMEPTRIYVKPVLELLARHDIHAMAHVTGGALVEKIIRVVPAPLGLDIDTSSWPLPAVFDWLQREGNVAREEMWRTFNCGIGYVLMADPADVAAIEADLDRLQLAHWRIGQVTPPRDGERLRIR